MTLKYAFKRINRALYGDDYAKNSVVAVNSAKIITSNLFYRFR